MNNSLDFFYIINMLKKRFSKKDIKQIDDYVSVYFPKLKKYAGEYQTLYILELPEIEDEWGIIRITSYNEVNISSSLYVKDEFKLSEESWSDTPAYRYSKELPAIKEQLIKLNDEYKKHLADFKMEQIKNDFE